MLLRGSLASVQSEPSATWLGPPILQGGLVQGHGS